MSCIVLKFGSSILPDESHLPHAIHEIYRHVRAGRKVIAVVSAFAGETDRLLAKARSFGDSVDEHTIAALVATGEAHAVALLSLALDRAGVPANSVDPGAISLRTHGAPLDSDPIAIHTSAIERLLADRPVLVVPGFIGRDHLNRAALLGRGGSDFSALYIAAALKCPCVLLKDVDAIYDSDPASNHDARRFVQAHYDDVLKLPEGIVQHKAVRFAKQHGVSLHIGAIGRPVGTVIGAHASRMGAPARESIRPLRVALLGLGTVGRGVYEHALRLPHALQVTAIGVRDVSKHDVPAGLLSTDVLAVAASGADIVVETMGGLHPAREAILAALEHGSHVVTANKTVVSRYVCAQWCDAAVRRGGGRCGSCAGSAGGQGSRADRSGYQRHDQLHLGSVA
jgi:homoserine dehydrogenase